MQSISSRWANLFLYTTVIFGAILRFAPTIITGQPINDGGMFYVMIQDLTSNQFVIPAFTSYNHLNIPYAYPPLSFYLGGLLSLLGIPILEIIRWVPPLVSTLSIIAFYWMASLMLDSKTKATLATMVYALIPRSFSWYVMGGGLSRSFGVLFLILSCASTWALFTRRESKYIILTMMCGAGAILSHPETGLHAATACALIWIFKGRNIQGFRDSSLVILGVVLLTGPWWGTILFQHGFTPFQSALRTGGNGSISLLLRIRSGINLTEENLFPLAILIGIAGFVLQVVSGNWFLPFWSVFPFFVEWRSATAISILPLSILAGSAISDLIIPLLVRIKSNLKEKIGDWTGYMAQNRLLQLSLGFYLFYAFIGAFIYDFSLSNYIIPTQSLDAMKWVKTNTPSNSRFIVLTGRSDPFSDPTLEWFPAITTKTSQNTIQGKEWLLGNDFIPFLGSLDTLRTCLNDSVACVTKWAETRQLGFDYIYIEKQKSDLPPSTNSLLYLLHHDNKFVLVFENDGATIFERK
jgi:hypothetical protein